MKHLFLAFILFVGLLFISVNAFAQPGMNRYIATVQGPADQAIERAGGRVIHQFQLIPVVSFMAPEAAIGGLLRNPNIIDIMPDWGITTEPKPSKPGKGKPGGKQPPESLEWGVDRIDADMVWDKDGDLVVDPGAITGYGINVAIIDTGIDKDHPDLAGNLGGGQNFVPKGWKIDPSKWDDDNGHGTHVAGIVGAIDNDIGVIGVAPEVTLYALKVLDRSGSGYLSDVMAAIEWCILNNIDVANMSLGLYSKDFGDTPESTEFEDLCNQAVAAKVTLVAAAGNQGDKGGEAQYHYPSAYASVISVGATASDDNVASWSNPGSQPDNLELAAPGVNVCSTWKGGGYNTISGTSMATPHVTGTVALALDNDVNDVRGTLQATAEDLGASGWDAFYGYGLVDAEAAVFGTASGAPPRYTLSPRGKLSVTWGKLKGE